MDKVITVEQPIEEAKPKSRAKKPKTNNTISTPVEELIEQPIEEAKPIKKKDTIVECEHCGKKMNAKTLTYNHSHNCPATKFKDQKQEQTEQPEKKIKKGASDFNEEIKLPTARELILSRRQEMIHNIMKNVL